MILFFFKLVVVWMLFGYMISLTKFTVVHIPRSCSFSTETFISMLSSHRIFQPFPNPPFKPMNKEGRFCHTVEPYFPSCSTLTPLDHFVDLYTVKHTVHKLFITTHDISSFQSLRSYSFYLLGRN